jgi:hypothetical protein
MRWQRFVQAGLDYVRLNRGPKFSNKIEHNVNQKIRLVTKISKMQTDLSDKVLLKNVIAATLTFHNHSHFI